MHDREKARDNPSPFEQPFLEVVVKGHGVKCVEPKNDRDAAIWYIDVQGMIAKYIDADHCPTELLREFCKSLAQMGIMVIEYDRYVGSGGASHVLRNGALFQRMRTFDEPDPTVFAFEYREPRYRGPR